MPRHFVQTTSQLKSGKWEMHAKDDCDNLTVVCPFQSRNRCDSWTHAMLTARISLGAVTCVSGHWIQSARQSFHLLCFPTTCKITTFLFFIPDCVSIPCTNHHQKSPDLFLRSQTFVTPIPTWGGTVVHVSQLAASSRVIWDLLFFSALFSSHLFLCSSWTMRQCDFNMQISMCFIQNRCC